MPRKIYLQLGSTQSVKGGSLWVHNLHSELQDSQNQNKKTLEIKQKKKKVSLAHLCIPHNPSKEKMLSDGSVSWIVNVLIMVITAVMKRHDLKEERVYLA